MLYSDNAEIINTRLTTSMIVYNGHEFLIFLQNQFSISLKNMSRLFLRLFDFKVSTLG